MIKFAQQQSVNNLHIPFVGFDLVPDLYRVDFQVLQWKTSRGGPGAMVTGAGEEEPVWGTDWP